MRIGRLVLVGASMWLGGCALSNHPVRPASLGQPATLAQLEALIDQPGTVEVRSVASADWRVPLSGLLDLSDPRAKAAGMAERNEPIHIYAHVLRHPTRGTYLIDTGVSRRLADDPAAAGVPWLVRRFMPLGDLKLRESPSQILRNEPPLQGVLFTHLHVDHIAGMAEIGPEVRLFVGPGESTHREWEHLFVRGMTNAMLAGKAPLEEWPFAREADGLAATGAILDVFGDGMVFAISVPGHTAGSTAYVVRTPTGTVLFTGDCSHTRWGWDHDVPPGSYSWDRARSRASLEWLEQLARRHPSMQVRLGHQD